MEACNPPVSPGETLSRLSRDELESLANRFWARNPRRFEELLLEMYARRLIRSGGGKTCGWCETTNPDAWRDAPLPDFCSLGCWHSAQQASLAASALRQRLP